MKRLTDEQLEWFKQHKELSLDDSVKLFNATFNESKTAAAIKPIRYRNGLTKSVKNSGQFKKGHATWNKGKSTRLSPKSEFKKGSIPKNTRPVGSEWVDKDDYILVKVAEPSVWIRKHRYLYQQAHGDIPKNHVIVFLDGNNRNFEIDNLMMISCSENATFNIRGYSKLPPELQITARLKTKLDYELSKITGLIEGYFDHVNKHDAGKPSRNKMKLKQAA